MPLISVIVPTLRVGGLDILFAGLEKQTFRDFELVLVDSLWKYRHDVVVEKSASYSFPITYVEPIDNPFPVNSYQRCVNSGLAHASGRIAYFTCDYSWLPPNCLEEHSKFHASSDGNTAMLGVCHLLGLPALNPAFNPKYGLRTLGMGSDPLPEVLAKWDDDTIRHQSTIKWCDEYCADLGAGVLDPFMWSIFENEFSAEGDPRSLPIVHEEMKKSLPEGFVQPQFCHLKNDSIPIERLLALNGFDERYDGCHGWQDSEVADRLAMRLGMKWYLKPDNLVHITDVHELMIIRKMSRVEKSNEQFYLADHASGYPNHVNPHMNLREIRAKFISQ